MSWAILGEQITGADIVRMVESIGKRSRVMARKAFSVNSVIFGHGVGKHLAKVNPCVSVRLQAVLGKRRAVLKTKSLSEDELRVLLPMVDGIGRSRGLAGEDHPRHRRAQGGDASGAVGTCQPGSCVVDHPRRECQRACHSPAASCRRMVSQTTDARLR
jgi:hypothetical protein